jgi:hypothetical protein
MQGIVTDSSSFTSVPRPTLRQIAELAVQLARQRVIVKHALDTGQHSEMAESLLNALEGSLRIFETHRIFLLSSIVSRPSKRIIQAPRPAD